MSETQYEEPVYVVNKQRRESEAVVHMPDRSGNATRIPSPQPETMNNGRTEWTVADAAVLFKEPVEDLVSDFAIEAISGGSEYQLNQNGSVDISRRELSAPAGSRVSVPRHPSARRRAKQKPSPKMRPGFPLPRTIGNGAEYQLGHFAPTDIFRRVFTLPEACLEHAKRG